VSRWANICLGAGRPAGAVVVGIGIAMALCGVVGLVAAFFSHSADISEDIRQAIALGLSSVITVLVGGVVRWRSPRDQASSLSRRQAIFSVAVIWLASGVFGALPYLLAARMSPIDSLFEAFSGFTTTGATVVDNIETTLKRPLLLWRSITQWLGGMGIVVLFVAVLPNVGVGAKIMFHGEVPGATLQDLRPRIADTSSFLWRAYLLLTVVATVLLWAVGMSPFEALCHAMTSAATGGFSTRSNSIAAFESLAIELVIAGVLLVSSINFGLYYAAISGRSLRGFIRSTELRVFGLIALISTLILTVCITPHHGSVTTAFRRAFFESVSFVTSACFGTDSTVRYPPLAMLVLMFLLLIGGCSGSTSGGIKVERLILLVKMGLSQVHATFRPNVIRVVRMNGQRIHPSVLSDVAAFLVVYLGCLVLCSLLVSAIENAPAPVSFAASLSCLSNMGELPFHENVHSFAGFSAPTKLLLSLAMVLGRLEFFTLFALFLPDFWKR